MWTALKLRYVYCTCDTYYDGCYAIATKNAYELSSALAIPYTKASGMSSANWLTQKETFTSNNKTSDESFVSIEIAGLLSHISFF